MASAPTGFRTPWRTVYLHVEKQDALRYEADVLALKYAQHPHGADRAALKALSSKLPNIGFDMPSPGDFRLISSLEQLGATRVLFIGTPSILELRYLEIRGFGRTVLEVLTKNAPDTSHLALTVHGPGFGLDEMECFQSLVAGLLDGLIAGIFPAALSDVAIVESDDRRAERFEQKLDHLIKSRELEIDQLGIAQVRLEPGASESIRSAGYASDSKPMLFVAMPFREDMRDHYDYGILNAAQKAGFLCERADYAQFTGDVFEWVKTRIHACKAVVADLSFSNPNVYLEVGYAWGCKKPTILLLRDGEKPTFDAQGQRCLIYKRIKDIEEGLHTALAHI